MVQKKTTKKDASVVVTEKSENKSVKKNPSSKGKRFVAGTVLLAVTVVIWYFAGVQIVKFMEENGYLNAKNKVVTPNSTIVATIDGKDLRLGDVRTFAESVPQLAGLPFEMIYPQLLDTMINSRVMMLGAEKTGVESDPEVARALKLAREQVLSQAFLAKQLEAEMTPENLQEIYMNEMKNFERQEEIRARHILFATKKEADDAIVQLKAGVDFAMLANEKSLDKENKGGSLCYFTKNMMIPEFGNAVFRLKKGELSAPIKTPFGWHVVLVEDRRLAAPPSFEAVQDQLKQIYAERNVKNVITKEREKAKVNVLVPRL